MQDCINCKTPYNIISTNCIRTEEKLSFDYDSFNDILHNFDNKIKELNLILFKKLDKKSLEVERDLTIDYIQDIINRLDILNKKLSETKSVLDTKLVINTSLFTGEQSIIQIISIFAKEIESLKNTKSSLYQ